MATVGNRYTGANGTSTPNQNSTTTTGPSSSTTNGSSNSATNQSGSSSSSTQTDTRNMSAQSEAALNTLIRQLLGGGTQQMAQERAIRQQEIGAVQGIRSGYSRENAFGDAQGAMAQQMRLALEKMMPQLVRASEGAGTSQNSMRALMQQQAANQAAESASALGLKAAVDYGGLQTNLSSVLERLTAANDPTANLLINALNVAKGAVTSSTTNQTGTNSNSSNTVGNTTSETNNSGGTVATQYTTPNQGGLSSIGPVDNTLAPVGRQQSLVDMLASAGAYNGWQDYTF